MMDVQVFNRQGFVIGELRCSVEEVTWRRNSLGRVRARLSKGDIGATQELLEYGNRVLLRFDNGLPSFGGIIDPPRKWDGDSVEVTIYSGDYLLKFYKTTKTRFFPDASVGYIAQRVIEEANTGVLIGEIWTGGNLHTIEYHYNQLDTLFNSLFNDLSTADYVIEPQLNDNRLQFILNVYERRGIDKPGIALHEGFNVTEGTTLHEQGPIVNDWTVVGDGSGWGDERPTRSDADNISINQYGLREGSIIATGITDTTTLQSIASTNLVQTKRPHNIFSIAAVNKKPGLFSDYDIGDSVMAEMPGYGFGGFRGMVRVDGRSFQPNSGICTTNVREEAT